ncbi:hypothetical protein [Actinacidiphila sp. bgisy167]|uniref:hypothetical protein n=1 Tax=Actinacidiphila sp. bgisy167 TaxID=3413797 RepID=UPI003D71C458
MKCRGPQGRWAAGPPRPGWWSRPGGSALDALDALALDALDADGRRRLSDLLRRVMVRAEGG